jgi:hypothetical protein
MGRVGGVRLLAGMVGIAWGMLAWSPAMAQTHGVELGNNLFIVTNLAKSTTYKTDEFSGPDRTYSVWDGQMIIGGTTIRHSGLRGDVEAMQRAIATCDERELTRLKLSALEFLEYLAVSAPALAARLAQYIRAARMTCDGQTYTAGENSNELRAYFTRTFGPTIRRLDEAAKAREAKKQSAAQTAPPPVEDILSEIEQDREALQREKKAGTKNGDQPPQTRKESKSVRDKPQLKKVVTVTGKPSAVDRKMVPADISKATPPPSASVGDVAKLKPHPRTGGTATIGGVDDENARDPGQQTSGRNERFVQAAAVESEGSRLLAQLQGIRGCRPPEIDDAVREWYFSTITVHSILDDRQVKTYAVSDVPGVRQLERAIESEDKRVSALPICPPSIHIIGVNAGYGQINRPDFGTALQLESGGVINNRNFGSVDRTDDYQGFGVNGAANIEFGTLRHFIFGYNYGHTSSAANSAALSTGGNGLNILSPQGPAGALGGGVTVPGVGGFADVTGLHYDDSYDEHLFYIGFAMEHWHLPQTGARVTPSIKALFGYVNETSDYSGTTAAGTLDFGYSSKLETTRYGLAAGLDVEQPLSGAFGLYLNGELRAIENHTSADSTLTLSGALNTAEGAHVSANKLDLGGRFGGGFYYQTGNVMVRAGASYETWRVPALKFSESGPVSIDYGTRESITATLTARFTF